MKEIIYTEKVNEELKIVEMTPNGTLIFYKNIPDDIKIRAYKNILRHYLYKDYEGKVLD